MWCPAKEANMFPNKVLTSDQGRYQFCWILHCSDYIWSIVFELKCQILRRGTDTLRCMPRKSPGSHRAWGLAEISETTQKHGNCPYLKNWNVEEILCLLTFQTSRTCMNSNSLLLVNDSEIKWAVLWAIAFPIIGSILDLTVGPRNKLGFYSFTSWILMLFS